MKGTPFLAEIVIDLVWNDGLQWRDALALIGDTSGEAMFYAFSCGALTCSERN